MCLGRSKPIGTIVLDSTRYTRPTLRDMVGATVESRSVKGVNLGCDFIAAFIGVALIVAAVAMIVISHNAYGITHKMILIYICLGVLGFTGVVLSALSVKRMVESCRKYSQFQADVTDVT